VRSEKMRLNDKEGEEYEEMKKSEGSRKSRK
jgi:hypothetical protein